MKELSFTTNIMCGSCVTQVKPKLDSTPGIQQWAVDTATKEKILTVSLDESLSAEVIISTIRLAGFTATERHS